MSNFATGVQQSSPAHKGDKLKQLRAFCRAAQLGSISQAAEQVSSSQPAVSLLVRALEDELGVPLFERSGPRIALTRVGRSLYQYAMPLVERMDRLPDNFAEQYYGVMSDTLVIGAGETSATFLLPHYLGRFREACPGVRVSVRIGNGTRLLSWLRAYEADLILLTADCTQGDLDFHQFRTVKYRLVTPKDHPLAGKESVTFEDIAAHPFVRYSQGRYVRQVADTLMRLRGLIPTVSVEVDGWCMVKRYVAAGLGISVVPEICITSRDCVWSTPIDRLIPSRRYGVLTRGDGHLSLAAGRLLQIMSEDAQGASDTFGAAGVP